MVWCWTTSLGPFNINSTCERIDSVCNFILMSLPSILHIKCHYLWRFHIRCYQEFGLIDKKELAPLQELVESIVPYWREICVTEDYLSSKYIKLNYNYFVMVLCIPCEKKYACRYSHNLICLDASVSIKRFPVEVAKTCVKILQFFLSSGN